MAEPLKNSFGTDVPKLIADMVAAVYPDFDRTGFLVDSLDGFDELELTQRARHIADALASHLPGAPDLALEIIVASLGPEIGDAELSGMEVFRYLPFVYFVADRGLDHFEEAMAAQYELTKRFTAEFSIRVYLEHYPQATLEYLNRWARDESVHVRRLVSEGSRPRLPWAPRLKRFQKDPTPVIELLELLKDDPEEYVRRSVANNLNDISKDHPAVVVEVARRWSKGAGLQRRRLIRHALRTLVKRGDLGALGVLGYRPDSPVRIAGVRIEPRRVGIGDSVRITVDVENPDEDPHGALVDVVVDFVKANGSTSPKVFRGAERLLAAGERMTVTKTVSLRQQSTRTHYPGLHPVAVQLNGRRSPGGEFQVVA